MAVQRRSGVGGGGDGRLAVAAAARLAPGRYEGRAGGASNWCTGRLREDVARGGNGELILA